MKGVLWCGLAAGWLLAACDSGGMRKNVELTYPKTKRVDVQDTYFGTVVYDPYRWLEDDYSEETKEWVEAQNALTFGFLDQLSDRKEIQRYLEKVWNYEKRTAPSRHGDFLYFFKNDGLQNQSVLYRKPVAGGAEEVFLDPNTLSEDGSTSLGSIAFTADGSLMAYAVSVAGSDWRDIYIMDTDSKELLPDVIRDAKFTGIAWKGNEGFFYSRYSTPEGSKLSAKTDNHLLYYHQLGTDPAADALIFGRADNPRRYVGGYLTEDERILVISAANTTTGNALYYMDLAEPNPSVRTLVEEMDETHNVLMHADGYLYVLTNHKAPNNRLVRVSLRDKEKAAWQDVIPERSEVLSVSTGAGKFFAQYLKDALSYVEQVSYTGTVERVIELPGVGSASGFSAKEDAEQVYYTYTNYVQPPTVFAYDPGTGKSELHFMPEVAFDSKFFESKQVFYTSKDGTKIPMVITHKKGLNLDGNNPTMLYGYGGFGVSLTPSFSVGTTAWLANGGVYAVPNIRGGGEYGDNWHLAGTKLKKQNVFDDFIAAAEYLIEEGYTRPERLALRGGSNGGLLVGAVMTQRPDLMQVALPAVGVLDMLRYHTFTAGAGWAYDYGTVEDSEEMFRYLKGYSPLHQLVTGKEYPATLVTTADHDDRVVPAHSFKFAATLQEKHKGNAPVLIRIETNAGHGAGKPTAKTIAELADIYAFTFDQMGVPFKVRK
ncbi:prolyl oligopeptidase family serine peptidase [Nitritalea halalkaliphila]|nr:prolyl oligopeptidase family serine peptidase [Nitritalea halalkaliphila]